MRAQLLATLIVVTASFDRVAAQTPPVIVSAWPTNQVIFPGATNVSFYAVAVGTAPLQYDWFFNGVKLENETNAVQILRQRHQFHVATEPRSVKKANSYQWFGLAHAYKIRLSERGSPGQIFSSRSACIRGADQQRSRASWPTV